MNRKANISAIRYHRRFSRQQQVYEKYAARGFYVALKDQVRQFVGIARNYPAGMEAQAVNEIDQKGMARTYQRVALRVGNGYAKISQAEITAEETGQKSLTDRPQLGLGHITEVVWNQHPYEVKEIGDDFRELINAYLRLYGAGKVRGITETTRRWIVNEIAKGQENNMSFDQVAKMLLSSDIPKSRAKRISRTETVKFMNLGRFLAADKSNFEKEKVWVSAHDARVRPGERASRFDHHDAHIQRTDLYESFKVSGEKLMFPGDTSLGASAGNVINCRCSFALQSKRDEQGRLIVKPKMYMGDSYTIGFPVGMDGYNMVRNLTLATELGQLAGLTFETLFS